ncbi:peptidoglycan bridge formation glycyltransferase FemA/FemB family protein [Candidatus Microgenomates bacterium]|nr:peptidoglycan bridge formation glycyltransferase FemA/FemB family protein [Candidatus Microgenomates bacterium]
MSTDNLLQSKRWAEFQKALGREVFWIEDALLIKNNLPKNKCYLFCPWGPEKLNQDFLFKAKLLAKKEKAIFIRVEPRAGFKTKGLGYRIKKTKDIHPKNTLVLDLTQGEEELLKNLKQKTRYNINLAAKKGVKIETTTNPEHIKVFYKIIEQTNKRDHVRSHSKDYYKKMLESLGDDGILRLYLARYNNQYIAGNLIAFYGNTATYLHGASSDSERNVMAPYLLQWQAIKDAKEYGCQYYDFFGIAPNDSVRHPWAGITRFKKGFGGTQINFPGTYDVVISGGWYMMYKIFRTLNRLR